MQSDSREALFDQSLEEAIIQVRDFPDVDVVIAIPFYNEKETLPEILAAVELGLQDVSPIRAALVLCVGDPVGEDVLEAVKQSEIGIPHIQFLMKPGANGRGASIRAIFELCRRLETDLVILAADLKQIGTRGFQPSWVKRLLEPIRQEYDLAVASFERHAYENVIGTLFAAPILEVFYNYRLHDPLSGVYAIAHDLLEDYCLDIKFWTDITQGYGIDPWIITRAICWGEKICEVKLGAKINVNTAEKTSFVFKEVAAALFECIKRDDQRWLTKKQVLKHPDACGGEYHDIPCILDDTSRALDYIFSRGLDQYEPIFSQLLPDLPEDLAELKMNTDTWSRLVYNTILSYWFNKDISDHDMLNVLTYAFNGRLAEHMREVDTLSEALYKEANLMVDANLMSAIVDRISLAQRQSFLSFFNQFSFDWQIKSHEDKPAVSPAQYLEFIPGLPIILPKEIEGRDSRKVWTEGLFNRLQSRYQASFNTFMFDQLNDLGRLIPGRITEVTEAGSGIAPPLMVARVESFVSELEQTLERLLPGNLHTAEGARRVASAIFKLMPLPKMFSIKTSILEEMLYRFPPLNVIISLGYRTPRELIEGEDIRDAVTIANLMETRKYADRALLWILDNVVPEHMEEIEIKPLFLKRLPQESAVSQASISDLNKITTRITINPLSKGVGGEFPRLRFCLYILRHIMVAEDYSRLWKVYTRERKNLGEKIGNSLLGRYHTDAFSAHNIFESMHHRSLVAYVRRLAAVLEERGQLNDARVLRIASDAYGLSQVLDDGTFLPCSSWTWASYRFKGGKGIPSPMSSVVEEKLFNHELLEEIQSELGYPLNDIDELVVQMIGEGRASENLLDIVVGIKPHDVIVVPQDTEFPPARPLQRADNNPLLCPVATHGWESRYVLNAATVRIKDKVYILYRAFGDDEISRIGLAVSDGYSILERLPEPVFAPANEKEKRGCEDPRVVIINGDIIMLYTAYDGEVAQIAAASISVDDFVNFRFDSWKRMGLAFEGVWDKDAILFPEKINDRYVIYHRIEPSVWVSYMDELAFPVPKEKHSIIFGPRSGRMWDSLKIGAGTQPIKTEYGWLMIYHGVDRNLVYRLGVILVDYNDPERLLYRSPNPILSPEGLFETGVEGKSWVPNVVFTCGAVPAEDKETLGADDELLVYYGSSDTYICLASGTIGDLIPESIRKSIKR